ncbi:MAG: carbohydrate kinase family protein [Anaerolineae bacterium]|jgi:sugar/nucleoside kinase (ribokinase family)
MIEKQTRPYDLLIAGELNVDIILQGDVTPEFGQVEKLVDDLTVCAGGSASIFAAAAARMGLRVLYVSRVGDDLFGHYMIDAMRAVGIDTSHIIVDPEIKTGATVSLSHGQDRAMLTYLGSIAAIGPQDLPADWHMMARHLHVASPFLLNGLFPTMPSLMRQAKAAGMTVSMDTNWDPAERWELEGFFDALDVFIPNEQEVLAISGECDLERAVDVMEARVPVLVVKRGGDGALAVAGDERLSLPAYPVEVADTTGAGDTFDGGFLAGWLSGEPLKRCLQLGLACGASAVMQVGGFNGQPTWDEALALIRRYSG